MDLARLAAAARALLPGAGVGAADPRTPHPAWPGEDIGAAVPRRLNEFRAGRAAARAALAELSLPPVAILVNPDRSPAFPPGLAGSITHTATAALAAVLPGARGLGIDLEPAEPLPPELWDSILSPTERAACDSPVKARLVFAAKEAAYKAQYPATRRLLEFDALAITLDATTVTATFTAPAGPFPAGHALTGRHACAEGHLLAAVTL